MQQAGLALKLIQIIALYQRRSVNAARGSTLDPGKAWKRLLRNTLATRPDPQCIHYGEKHGKTREERAGHALSLVSYKIHANTRKYMKIQ